MTDEQLEKQIIEEFEKWEKSCDSYELRKSYDAEVEKRFGTNKKNPNHINEEDALQASRAEAWGKEAFKAAALPLMKKIEEKDKRIGDLDNTWRELYAAVKDENLHLKGKIFKLQKENEELKKKAQMNIHNSAFTGLLVENEELREALDWAVKNPYAVVHCEHYIKRTPHLVMTSDNYKELEKYKEICTKFNLDKEGGK